MPACDVPGCVALPRSNAQALLFWIDGATSVLAALLLIALRLRLTTHADPDAADAPHGPGPSRHATFLRPTGPWRYRAFVVALASTFAIAMVFMQFFFTAPLHYELLYGLDEAAIGLLSALNSLIIVAVEMALVHALRSRRPLPVVALGALAIATGFGMTPLGTTFWFGAVAVAVWTLGEMLESPLLMAWVASRASTGDLGRYMALLTMVHSLAFLLAPIAGTWAFAQLGPAWLWLGCLVVGCTAALGFAWAARIDARRALRPT